MSSNSKTSKNIAASIHQRLLNKAQAENRPFNELLQYYGMERFLYRLSQSPYADKFILKGALMLRVWGSPQIRPTMDIDLLGITSNNEADIVAQIKDILSVEVGFDGLIFDTSTIRTERIAEDADYEGIRIRFRGSLGNARVSIQIDIGFGDIIYPGPQKSKLPVMLDSPIPTLLGYSRESAIAEKFSAMVKLREINSRMKDFYDIWLLSRQFDFNGKQLAEAIRLTFDKHQTDLPEQIVAFSNEFIELKQTQWVAFAKRLKMDTIPTEFSLVVLGIKDFLEPVVDSLIAGKLFTSKWIAPGPWA
jgi:predicted nucleotidyltransferase component of viral defense system